MHFLIQFHEKSLRNLRFSTKFQYKIKIRYDKKRYDKKIR